MYYSKRDEMLKYFNEFADSFGLRDYITFNTEVTRLEYDEAAQRWHVTYREGDGAESTLDANVVVSAVGIFAEPKVPPIQGLGTFEGPTFPFVALASRPGRDGRARRGHRHRRKRDADSPGHRGQGRRSACLPAHSAMDHPGSEILPACPPRASIGSTTMCRSTANG